MAPTITKVKTMAYNFQTIIKQVTEQLDGKSEHHQSVSFHHGKKRYVVSDQGTYFIMYRVLTDGTFLPGCKKGKAFSAIRNHINKNA